jgi:hypothetical protein
VNEAPQDMMIIRAKAMLGEGDAIPSTDGFAETLENRRSVCVAPHLAGYLPCRHEIDQPGQRCTSKI